MPKDVVELLASWPSKFSKDRNGLIWNMVPHCLIWSIWRESNTRIFEGTEDQFKTWRLPSSRLCLGGQMCQVFSLSILCLICSIDVVFTLISFVCLLLPLVHVLRAWFFLYLFFLSMKFITYPKTKNYRWTWTYIFVQLKLISVRPSKT